MPLIVQRCRNPKLSAEKDVGHHRAHAAKPVKKGWGRSIMGHKQRWLQLFAVLMIKQFFFAVSIHVGMDRRGFIAVGNIATIPHDCNERIRFVGENNKVNDFSNTISYDLSAGIIKQNDFSNATCNSPQRPSRRSTGIWHPPYRSILTAKVRHMHGTVAMALHANISFANFILLKESARVPSTENKS